MSTICSSGEFSMPSQSSELRLFIVHRFLPKMVCDHSW